LTTSAEAEQIATWTVRSASVSCRSGLAFSLTSVSLTSDSARTLQRLIAVASLLLWIRRHGNKDDAASIVVSIKTVSAEFHSVGLFLIAAPTNVVEVFSMTRRLLFVFIVMIGIFSTTSAAETYQCWMCDNVADGGKCDRKYLYNNNETLVKCPSEWCSVTSYVRRTRDGCKCSCILLAFRVACTQWAKKRTSL